MTLRRCFAWGEMLADRQTGYTKDTLLAQMGAALANLPAEKMETLVIAYEPVWAIGTGSSATPEVADQAHAMIREEIKRALRGRCARTRRGFCMAGR